MKGRSRRPRSGNDGTAHLNPQYPARLDRDTFHAAQARVQAERERARTREERNATDLRTELDVLRAQQPIDWPTVTPGSIDAQAIARSHRADADSTRTKAEGEQAWNRVVRRHEASRAGDAE